MCVPPMIESVPPPTMPRRILRPKALTRDLSMTPPASPSGRGGLARLICPMHGLAKLGPGIFDVAIHRAGGPSRIARRQPFHDFLVLQLRTSDAPLQHNRGERRHADVQAPDHAD